MKRRAEPARSGEVTLLAWGVVLLLAVAQIYTVPYTGLGESPAQMIFTGAALLWAVTRLTGRPGTRGVRSLRIAMGLVVATQILAYGIAMTQPMQPGDVSTMDVALRTSIEYLAVTLFVVEAVRSWADVELIVKCLVGAGAVSGFMALTQSLTGIDLATKLKPPGLRTIQLIEATRLREGLIRPQGTALHPLELAAVMTVLIPLGLSLIGYRLRRGQPAWLWIFATAMLAAGAAVALSRLALLGTAIAVTIIITRWPVGRAVWLATIVADIIGFQALFGSKVLSALGRLITQGSGDSSLASRNEGRAWVFHHLSEFFWVGRGPGTAALGQPLLDNEYLQQLVHVGVIGTFAFAVLAVTAPLIALRAGWRTPDRATGEFAIGVGSALVGLLLCFAVLDVEAFPQISLVAAVLMGLAGRCAVLARNEPTAAALPEAATYQPNVA